MNYSLPPNLERFVQHELAAGRYQSEGELVADAVRLLQQQKLREAIRSGVEGASIPGDQVFDELRRLASDLAGPA